MAANELETIRSHMLTEAYENIIYAEEADSELTMIKDYLRSIACSLYVLAAQDEAEGGYRENT